MSETTKTRDRVIGYCEGRGIDLGCGDDKIRPEAIGVDIRNLPGVSVVGDATIISWAEDGTFDYVYSSHFLEHVDYPIECMKEWVRILKAGGHLILYLPHREHYTEYNPEHKHELTMEMVLEWVGIVGDFEVLVSEMDVEGPDRYSFLIIAKKKGESHE